MPSRHPVAGLLFVVTLIAGCDAPALLTPDPPWSSPSCYDSREPYRTASSWTVETFPWFPHIDGGSPMHLEAVVAGDTFHGWPHPEGSPFMEGLALTNVTADGQPMPDLFIELSVDNAKRNCPPADMKGEHISILRSDRAAYEDVDHMTGGGATVLRNAVGQLLWAEVGGSLDEYGAEILPELRTVRLPSSAPVTESPCLPSRRTSNASVRRRRPVVELQSLSESKTYDGTSGLHSISIGCVEYLVVWQAFDVVAQNNCRDSQYSFSMSIIRRALLEPGPGCTP